MHGGINISVPRDHPRYFSLLYREKLVKALDKGILAKEGLIAQGRGEAFDYIFGEKTNEFVINAIKAASASLLLAKHPVISVNGNVVALVLEETVTLSKLIPADIEINLFYRTPERETAIKKEFKRYCPTVKILGVGKKQKKIPDIDSERGNVDENGIWSADVVLMPLEDGDRAQALKKLNKKTITVDLNPFSRTAISSDIAIVDNIVRTFPLIIEEIKKMKDYSKNELSKISHFDNEKNLKESIKFLKNRLDKISRGD
ncbi:MAG: phosphopantothenate/pantothenate synthetase [Candidatus Methanofastidiosia archaeon]